MGHFEMAMYVIGSAYDITAFFCASAAYDVRKLLQFHFENGSLHL